MRFFSIVLFSINLLLGTQIHHCSNYLQLNSPSGPTKNCIKCNFKLNNPKRVINPYKNDIQNYVELKPFGSPCVKCSMCLAISKEMDNVLKTSTGANKDKRHTEVVNILQSSIKSLCADGFKNYDLRKFKEFQAVTDDLTSSTHVRTKMDGRWTEKLRQMCEAYYQSMDMQFLFYSYLEGTNNLSTYLCSNNGIFRDCWNLNFSNISKENHCTGF